jgi:hypothetical protein
MQQADCRFRSFDLCLAPAVRAAELDPGRMRPGNAGRDRSTSPHHRRQPSKWFVDTPGGGEDISEVDALEGWWDNPTMIVTLDAKRRLTVPTGLAPASPGDYFDASFDAEEDALVFRRLPGKESWLTVLKACPVSPDDVPRRRRAPARRRKI